jgi:molybdopterin-synthase adenylyltransferase
MPPAGVIPTYSQAGILGAVAGMLGIIQAAETLKYFIGAGQLLTNALLTFDAQKMEFRKVLLRKNPLGAVCGDHPTILALMDEIQPLCELKKD